MTRLGLFYVVSRLDAPAGPAYGGTGRTFDWSKAAGNTSLKIILAGGLDADLERDRLVRGLRIAHGIQFRAS